MAAKVASCVYNINYFPDEVLCGIISFLSTEEAVRTSVLSRRWRYIFTLMTHLDFEVYNAEERLELDQFLAFVDRSVLLQYMPSILRFRLSCDCYINPQRLNKWICALVQNKIQELLLWAHHQSYDGLSLPESLFSCESLVALSLYFPIQTLVLKIPATVCLPKLKFLYIRSIVFLNNGFEERLFSSCPVLEDLVIHRCLFDRDNIKFNVSNQSLKRLTLRYNGSKEGIVCFVINAPSLVFLNYFIYGGQFLELVEVKSLVEAEIDSPPGPKYVTSTSSILSQIQNIQKLELSFFMLKDLQVFNVPIPLFKKMTCLNIRDWEVLFNRTCLEYFLSCCVVLETLVFEEAVVIRTGRITGMQLSQEKSQLGPSLSHLKTIKIQVFDIDEAKELMSVIEFFLGNAGVLEELKIHCRLDRSQQKSKIMERVFSFPRASKKCRVLI